jgi:hypothetical protein
VQNHTRRNANAVQINYPVHGQYNYVSMDLSKGRGFKPFVSSRVGEIQRNVQSCQWRHIASENNVADDVSRGITVGELSGRWKEGPDFLRKPTQGYKKISNQMSKKSGKKLGRKER